MEKTYKDVREELSRITNEIETAKEDVKAKRAKITKDLNAKLNKLHAKKNKLNAQLDELLLPVSLFLDSLLESTKHYDREARKRLTNDVVRSHLERLDIAISVADFHEWRRAYKERTAPKKSTAKRADSSTAGEQSEQARTAQSVGGNAPKPFASETTQ